MSWTTFSTSIKAAFQYPYYQQLLRCQLRNIKQTSTVQGYASCFRNLLGQIEEIAKADKVMYFTEGLKNVTKTEVNYHVPENLNNYTSNEINQVEKITQRKIDKRREENSENLPKSKKKNDRNCENLLKTEGKVQGQNALILIDSGASKGKTNVVADALSRKPEANIITKVSIKKDMYEKIKEEYKKDTYLKRILKALEDPK
ncbi:17527_t:CDS:2, partial [Cetraspora pellucida]